MLTPKPLKTWQVLLIQAFKETPFTSSRNKRCGVINLHRFVYLSLCSTGIENRSPFSIGQLLKIRIKAGTEPEKLRQACIDYVSTMQKPVPGFHSSALIMGLVAAGISLVFLLTPQTATTFRTLTNGTSILNQTPEPVPDIDAGIALLALTSDYSMPAESIAFLKPADATEHTSLAGKDWIRQQPDSAYSLQLIAASDIKLVEQYCKKFKLCGQSAIYQTQVNGKTVLRLLYGVFSDYQSVKIAQSKLPLELQQTRPWARQFKGVKQEL